MKKVIKAAKFFTHSNLDKISMTKIGAGIVGVTSVLLTSGIIPEQYIVAVKIIDIIGGVLAANGLRNAIDNKKV